MNAGQTSERVYQALRTRIVEHGFLPGDRLEPNNLADSLSSSVTPVRDALHRLVGEGLVETAVSEGFHVPHVTLPYLQDLYDWNRQILRLSLQAATPWKAMAGDVRSALPFAVRIAALFEEIAARSRNHEHHRAVQSANDRLCAARQVEADLFEDAASELCAIEDAFCGSALSELRGIIDRHHRKRRRAAAEIIRRLYHDRTSVQTSPTQPMPSAGGAGS